MNNVTKSSKWLMQILPHKTVIDYRKDQGERDTHLCCFTRTSLTNKYERLVPDQDIGKPFLILPDRELKPFLQDLIIARCVW